MDIVRGRVRAYDAATHTADVEPVCGPAALLGGLPVVAQCPAGFLSAGREVAVLLWDDVGGVVLGPYGANADDWAFAGQITQGTHVIRATFIKTGIADNTATTIFRVRTTDEPGDYDAGGYACFVRALIGHALGPGNGSTATKAFNATFCRAMQRTGTGVNSAVLEIAESASAATTPSARDISTVTMTLSEVSEYEVAIRLTIDLTGSGVHEAQVVAHAELMWYGFKTPPIMSGQ